MKLTAEELKTAKQEWETSQQLLRNLQSDVKDIKEHLQVFKEKEWLPVPDKEAMMKKEKCKKAFNDYLKEHGLEVNAVMDVWKLLFVDLEMTTEEVNDCECEYEVMVLQSQTQEVEELDDKELNKDVVFGV
mmetsp:Transcript_8016/g.14569  ORF Transcript_8016/g.14569 Transcript_8016/m.14569 type:complete len:131 (+) Transcript_8016:156-548(+)